MASSSYLDPLVIAQLGNLKIRARRVLDGVYSGRHNTRLRGASHDFSQHRPYHPGDDLRRLDWKVLGKTDRLVLKQFDVETNIQGIIVLDNSASMNYAHGGRLSKLEYAKTMAGALAYLLLSQNDAAGLVSSGEFVPPQSHRSILDPLFKGLERIKGDGIWNFREMAASLLLPIKKKSLLFVFSDLMADPDTVIKSLRALHSRRHEAILFQILDPVELDLSMEGPVVFHDVETGEKITTDPQVIRESYKTLVQSEIENMSRQFKGSGIEFVTITTDTPFDHGLGAYLAWREGHV